MTGAMAAFLVAVGATSPVCYALMTRLQNRRAAADRRAAAPRRDGGNYTRR